MNKFIQIITSMIFGACILIFLQNSVHHATLLEKIDSQVIAKDRKIDSLKTKLDYCKGRF